MTAAVRRWNVGERNPKARLTAQAVDEIRAAPPSISDADLARRYHVHKTTVNRARRRAQWKEENR